MRITLAGWVMKSVSGSASVRSDSASLLTGREHFVGVDGDVVVEVLFHPRSVPE